MSSDHRDHRRRPWPGLVLAGAVVFAVLLVGVSLLAQRPEPSSAPRGEHADAARGQTRPAQLRGNRLASGLAGSRAYSLDLPDARGGDITSRELRGRPYAVTFLFTKCTDVCPVIGQDLKDVLARLGPAGERVSVIAVSVDPKRDTPAAAREWLRIQRVPENFRYAVGTTAELRPVWRAYYAAPEIKRPPAMSTHSASVWLVDRRGRLRTRYSAGRPLPVEDVASDFRTLLAEDGT